MTSKPPPEKSLDRPIFREIRVRISCNVGTGVAESIQSALKPEVTQEPNPSIDSHLSVQGTSIIVTLEGNDVPTVRASLNTYLRLISASAESVATLEASR